MLTIEEIKEKLDNICQEIHDWEDDLNIIVDTFRARKAMAKDMLNIIDLFNELVKEIYPNPIKRNNKMLPEEVKDRYVEKCGIIDRCDDFIESVRIALVRAGATYSRRSEIEEMTFDDANEIFTRNYIKAEYKGSSLS